jgi:hypothetical protein
LRFCRGRGRFALGFGFGRVFRYLARFPVKRTAFALLRCSNGRECWYNRLFFRCRPLPLTCSGLTGVLPASKVYLTYSRPITGLFPAYIFVSPASPHQKIKNFYPILYFRFGILAKTRNKTLPFSLF